MPKYYSIPSGYSTIAKNKSEALKFFNEHPTTELKGKYYSFLEWYLTDITVEKSPSISTEMRGRDVPRRAILINEYELLDDNY